jgi:hypothetical protein
MKMGSRSSAARESPVVSTALNTASAIRITRAMNACRVPLRTTVASGLVENAKTRFGTPGGTGGNVVSVALPGCDETRFLHHG